MSALLPWQHELLDRLLERDPETGEFVCQAPAALHPRETADVPTACPFCCDPASPLPAIWRELQRERERAHRKHGATSMESADPDDPDAVRRDIITEEWGEVAKEYNEARHENRPLDRRRLRAELIQVAAMAAAWADALTPSTHVPDQPR